MPYNTPFMGERYPDLLKFMERFRYFHSLEFFSYTGTFPCMYPAPTSVVYELFYKTGHPLFIFLSFFAVSLVLAVILFGRSLQQRGLNVFVSYALPFMTVALSYPVWFDYRQANMEIVVWVFVSAGIALFLAGRGYSAAACFGMATSMKIFPVAYLGLLLIRRQYRQIAFGLTIGATTTVASLWLLGGSILPTWNKVNESLEQYKVIYALHKRPEMVFDHSLFSLIKSPIHLQSFPAPERLAPALTVYMACVVVVAVMLFFLRVWRLPVANQIVFIAVVSVLLPPVSFEYTLLQILAPTAVLVLLAVDIQRRGGKLPGLNASLACCCILLGAFAELIAKGHQWDGQIKAVVLVVLMILALTKPLVLPEVAQAQ
jgi:hypothetical protein